MSTGRDGKRELERGRIFSPWRNDCGDSCGTPLGFCMSSSLLYLSIPIHPSPISHPNALGPGRERQPLRSTYCIRGYQNHLYRGKKFEDAEGNPPREVQAARLHKQEVAQPPEPFFFSFFPRRFARPTPVSLCLASIRHPIIIVLRHNSSHDTKHPGFISTTHHHRISIIPHP